ncbi:MAG: glycosyltransferase family 9 protein [Candidatus Malihini olakiniferum]
MPLYYNPEDAQCVFSLAPKLKEKPYFVIQQTANQHFKCWDKDKFAQFINYLKQ